MLVGLSICVLVRLVRFQIGHIGGFFVTFPQGVFIFNNVTFDERDCGELMMGNYFSAAFNSRSLLLAWKIDNFYHVRARLYQL